MGFHARARGEVPPPPPRNIFFPHDFFPPLSPCLSLRSAHASQDAAHSCIKLIGEIGNGAVQFKDLNPDLTPFQRRYVSYIKRCEELEHKLKYFSAEIAKLGLPLQSNGSLDKFLTYSNEANAGGGQKASGLQLLEHMERDLEKHEAHLKELNSYNANLVASRNTKMELQQVMNKTQEMMGEVSLPLQQAGVGVGGPGGDLNDGLFDTGGFGMSNLGPDEEDRRGLLGDSRQMDMRFTATTGVIPAPEQARFERMLFRATRGNCFFQFMDIDTPLTDPVTGEITEKKAFVIFYKSATIASKIKRICDAFGASVYNLPDLNDKAAIGRLKEANGIEIRESQTVLNKNREQRVGLCTHLAQFVVQWQWEVLREKATYHTLNMFKADVTGMLRAEGWIVSSYENRVSAALSKADLHHMQDVARQLWPTPPTHFEVNKFTSPFQDFVDTYGVPRYKEANPALFTAVTFPFLFGVMYGDIGHGSILLLGGLMLVLTEHSVDPTKMDEMSAGVFSARYMILLMGAFAVYAGLIYNDFFALGLNLFGSTYEWEDGLKTEAGTTASYKGSCSYGDSSCVYPFGVDPAWHISSNELLFFNSMKMKMSVILGIAQMTVGICLKGLNAYYFKEQLDFLFEFLPMIVFDMCFFGYMVLLIFMKWTINWDERMYMATCNEDNANWPACAEDGADYTTAQLCPLDYGGTGDGCQPPNLITTLMNMALMPGSVGDPMYAGQATVQVLLLLLAGISVPILLVAKPLMLKSQMAQDSHNDRDRNNSEVGGW